MLLNRNAVFYEKSEVAGGGWVGGWVWGILIAKPLNTTKVQLIVTR